MLFAWLLHTIITITPKFPLPSGAEMSIISALCQAAIELYLVFSFH